LPVDEKPPASPGDIYFFAKPRFSALKCGKCVKKCVTGKKKNRLNPVFKRLFCVFSFQK
jgi:hypothetical protein